ncbi:hypothetical protein [Desulfoplanes sp.]
MDEQQVKLPQKTILLIVIGFVLLAGGGLGIHLTYKPKIERIQGRIAGDTGRISMFEKLYPTYSRLLSVYQKRKAIKTIPFDPATTAERDISGFGHELELLCEKAGMQFVSATPRPETIEADKQRILVETKVRGGFAGFRRFLVRLLGMPSLAHVQQIQVHSVPENREYSLELWVRFT